MADDNNTDDNIFGTADKDDGISDIVDKFFDEAEETETDSGGLDQPLETEKSGHDDIVDADKGAEILSDAELGLNKESKTPEDEPKAGNDDKGNKDDADEDAKTGADEANKTPGAGDKAKTEDKSKTGEDEAGDEADRDDADKAKETDLTQSNVDSLLEGLPDTHKGEINRRLQAATDAMAPFDSPYIKQQMQQFGASPVEVSKRLVELASFAAEKPAEYLAWAATESAAPDKMEDLLQETAKLLGFKVSKLEADAEDDDLFDDPEKAQMKARIAELEAAQKGDGPTFGPDTPERKQGRTAQDQLDNFINERDASGQLVRPHFGLLQGRISAMAKTHVETNKTAVTPKELQQFYDTALQEAQSALGTPATPTPPDPSTSAATPKADVADKTKKDNAAAERAQKASKTIDGGTGQSANRQPAIAKDAPLTDVIDQLWDNMTG